MSAPFLTETKTGIHLAVKLQPRASRQAIAGVNGNELKISVTAPPVDSAANHALIEFLGDVLDQPRSTIELVRGHTSRHKTVLVRGLTTDALLERLRPHLK